MQTLRVGKKGPLINLGKNIDFECKTCFSLLRVTESEVEINDTPEGKFFEIRCSVCGSEFCHNL